MFYVVISATVSANTSTGVVLRRLSVNILAETFVWPRSEFSVNVLLSLWLLQMNRFHLITNRKLYLCAFVEQFVFFVTVMILVNRNLVNSQPWVWRYFFIFLIMKATDNRSFVDSFDMNTLVSIFQYYIFDGYRGLGLRLFFLQFCFALLCFGMKSTVLRHH